MASNESSDTPTFTLERVFIGFLMRKLTLECFMINCSYRFLLKVPHVSFYIKNQGSRTYYDQLRHLNYLCEICSKSCMQLGAVRVYLIDQDWICDHYCFECFRLYACSMAEEESV